MWWFVSLELIVLALVVTLILNIYVSVKNLSWIVYAASWLGWYMSFAIVILVPVDILASDFSNCEAKQEPGAVCTEPIAYLSSHSRVLLWRIFYWCSFLLTWLVYPFLRAYETTGHFKTGDKMQEAIQQNILYYAIVGIGALFGILYLVAFKEISWSSIVGVAMAAANAWGMFLLIALMGYGLVEIPRSLWRKAHRQLMLKYVKFQITSLQHGKIEAREYLTTTLKQIRKLADKMPQHNPMRGYLDIIVRQCPAAEFNEIKQQSDKKSSEISYGKLVNLNLQIKSAKNKLRHAESMYGEMLKNAFDLEDVIVASRNRHEKRVAWSFQPARFHRFAAVQNHLEWIWYIYLDSAVLLVLCGVSALLSCVIVWEEVTLAITGQDFSVFSLLVKEVHLRGILSQVVVFLPLAYAALAAYSTLFRIRLFNYYRLIPHQETDANSIMFSAAYLCRLCAPLSYNFMTFLHLPEKSSFEIVMGSMDIVPFLGEHFYLYFPLLILLVCIANLLNLTTRILQCLRIKRFQFDENFNDSAIEEGAQILQNERSRGVAALHTRSTSQEPVELLSLSVPLSTPPPLSLPPKPKPPKYGHSTRFARDEIEEEEEEEGEGEEEEGGRGKEGEGERMEKPLIGSDGFPAMHRIFGKNRVKEVKRGDIV